MAQLSSIYETRESYLRQTIFIYISDEYNAPSTTLWEMEVAVWNLARGPEGGWFKSSTDLSKQSKDR